jgi:ribosome-binding protein aMBF1 (putative translation factor)
MSVQILRANGKPVLAVLPIDEYRRLLGLAEDANDAEVLHRAAKRHASGNEEAITAEVVDRLLAGESPIRVWREHRGLTAAVLAEMIGVTPAHISTLETGKGEPSISLLKKLAAILGVNAGSFVGAGN